MANKFISIILTCSIVQTGLTSARELTLTHHACEPLWALALKLRQREVSARTAIHARCRLAGHRSFTPRTREQRRTVAGKSFNGLRTSASILTAVLLASLSKLTVVTKSHSPTLTSKIGAIGYARSAIEAWLTGTGDGEITVDACEVPGTRAVVVAASLSAESSILTGLLGAGADDFFTMISCNSKSTHWPPVFPNTRW